LDISGRRLVILVGCVIAVRFQRTMNFLIVLVIDFVVMPSQHSPIGPPEVHLSREAVEAQATSFLGREKRVSPLKLRASPEVEVGSKFKH
jgi:hypothetical protein